MTDEQIRSMIRTLEMKLDQHIIIPGTNWAVSKQWYIDRIEQLQSQLTNAQTSKTVRKRTKKKKA